MLTARNLTEAVEAATKLGHNPAEPTIRALGGDSRASYVCRNCQALAVLHISQRRPFSADAIEEVRVTKYPCTM